MRSRNTARVSQLVPHLEVETSHKNHLCSFGGGGSNPGFLACGAAFLARLVPPTRRLKAKCHPAQRNAASILRPEKSFTDQPAEPDHHAGSFLCALTQGRDPQLPVAGEIGASKLKAKLSDCAESHPRAMNTLLRNSVSNFPAPAPCLSPQIASQGRHLMLEQNTQLRRRAS